MEIKGNIGDEVWIRAKIRRISVDVNGVMYTVEIMDRADGAMLTIDVNETDIKVRKADALAAALKAAEENHQTGAAPAVPDITEIPAEAIEEKSCWSCEYCSTEDSVALHCITCENFSNYRQHPDTLAISCSFTGNSREEIKDCKFCKHDTVTSTVCNGCEDFDKFEPLPEGQEEPEPDQVSEIWEGVKCETCAFKDRRGSEPPCNVCNSDFSAWAPIPDGVKRKRGRPKKATVEGLMEKARKAREKKGGAE